MTNPKVVLVDEASLGLAPLIIDAIYEALALLRERGMSIVVVEQYVQRVIKFREDRIHPQPRRDRPGRRRKQS